MNRNVLIAISNRVRQPASGIDRATDRDLLRRFVDSRDDDGS
jgi:hypothetical protein